jgi:uncharacterized membrane protein
MTWLQRYRVRRYVRNSLWIAPVAAMVTALIAVRVLHYVEERMGWSSSLDPDTTRTVLGTLAGAMFTFIVFVGSSLLLVVQLASAQMSPRVIGMLFRDRVTKATLSVFVFTFTFAMSALLRIDVTVPLLLTEIAGYGCAASLVVFLFLIDHVAKMLRPSGVFMAISAKAHQVIDNVYPRRMTDVQHPAADSVHDWCGPTVRTVTSEGGGVVLAFDARGLVALASRHDCRIELVPEVGGYIAPGDPIFRIHGGVALSAATMRHSIALGDERTIEQDPAFAFRVIVDIASKGLSPAINDPTTAVLAIDRIHHLLRHIGNRRLDNEKVRDASGAIRLVYRTPDWEEYVVLAVTEIRQFGASSIQIARRLRAMLEDLIRTLPEVRRARLQKELQLLERSTNRAFEDPEDRALAEIGDPQGVGGKHDSNHSDEPAASEPRPESARRNAPNDLTLPSEQQR